MAAPLVMVIRGSQTPDNPAGRLATKKQADKEAQAMVSPWLAKAGFEGYAVATERGWNLCVGAVVGYLKAARP